MNHNRNRADLYHNIEKAWIWWGMVPRVLDKAGGDDEVCGNDVQGSGTDGSVIWEQELGDEGGNDEGDGGVSQFYC